MPPGGLVEGASALWMIGGQLGRGRLVDYAPPHGARGRDRIPACDGWRTGVSFLWSARDLVSRSRASMGVDEDALRLARVCRGGRGHGSFNLCKNWFGGGEVGF